MNTYRDGSPRVHVSTPEREIVAAIEEYERRAPDFDEPLRSELIACATNLREELAMRVTTR